jgi:hypothetical protein
MGLTKVCDVAPNQPSTSQFLRNYNSIDIQQQLHNNVLVQDDFDTFDIEKP